MTFLTIIKIIPWVLTLAGSGMVVFYRKRMKWLDEKFDEHVKTISELRDTIVTQEDEKEKLNKTISDLLKIQEKYEAKKGKITGARSATEIIKELRGK